VRGIMAALVGVTRDAAGLAEAVAALRALIGREQGARVALMVALAALRREESRGGHFRRDFPQPAEAAPRRRTAGGLGG
jgi:L-aspartate oxidase